MNKKLVTSLAVAAYTLFGAWPAAAHADAPIQDNSFLIEEAYNQEAGVVQHISTLQLDTGSDAWVYSFTQEWPLGALAHQVSVTLLLLDAGAGAGLGDVALNYRYQLVGSGMERVAVSPRVSLLMPAGEEGEGRGLGVMGLQLNLPVSIVLVPGLVAHSNAGLTWAPAEPIAAGERMNFWSVNLGQSLVWLAHPRLNALVEIVATRSRQVAEPGGRESVDALVVSPGVRGAVDLGGLQIVPGVAVPIGVHEHGADVAVFFYLSFEHPFSEEN